MELQFSMEALFYYGTGVITIIALTIFLAGVIIARLPETQPRQVAYSMVRKHPRRRHRS